MRTTRHTQLASWLLLLAVTAAGFWLRWTYTHTANPFTDEFGSMLAAKMIVEKGLPILPSGLFYDHGLLFSYLDALFITALGFSEIAARLPSLLIGTATIPLLCVLGQRMTGSWAAGLLAATLLAFDAEAVTWGGRARMYALWQLLMLLAVFCLYQGAIAADRRRYRLLGILFFGCAALTHSATLVLLPPLTLGVLAAGWLVREQPVGAGFMSARKPWFLQHGVAIELAALAVVLAAVLLVGRSGHLATTLPERQAPVTTDAEPDDESLGVLTGAFTNFVQFDVRWESGLDRFVHRFTAPHTSPLTALAMLGLALLTCRLLRRRPASHDSTPLFLYVLLLGTVAEMVSVVVGYFRRPQYVFSLLPIFFLLATASAAELASLAGRALRAEGERYGWLPTAVTALTVVTAAWFYLPDARAAATHVEKGYNQAFRFVEEQRQPDDVIMTVSTPPCGLYAGRCDYYLNQSRLYVLEQPDGVVDRYLGLPLVNSSDELNRILADNERVWFVCDWWRLTNFFEPYLMQQIITQMEPLFEGDRRTFAFFNKADRQPIPESPAYPADANLADQVRLIGYSLDSQPPRPGSQVQLTVFWQAVAHIRHDYTVFVHLRNADNQTVAQADHRPLGAVLPTSTWPRGEVIRDASRLAIPADLPPGEYELRAGMYLLETLERLPVVNDTSGENAVVLGTITVVE